MPSETPAARLHQALLNAGLLVDGVSGSSAADCRVQWRYGVTPTTLQRQQATTLVATYDWRPRRPKTLAALQAEMGAWLGTPIATPARVQQALVLLLALRAQARPDLLRRHAIPIDGDEPVP